MKMEDYLQMVSVEQKEYVKVFDYSKITEKSGIITNKRVKSNKRDGGIHGMHVNELLHYLRENQDKIPDAESNRL